jgi:hypothetical protein
MDIQPIDSHRTGIVAVLLLLALCGNAAAQAPQSSSQFKSKFHPFQATWTPPWVRLEAKDSADKEKDLLQSFVNKEGRMSYVVRITPDVPQKRISDANYRAAVKKQQLAASKSARLIDEGNVKMHGLEFYRLRIALDGPKEQMCVYVYNRRDGRRNTTIQLAFPFDESLVKTDRLPDAFSALNVSFAQ